MNADQSLRAAIYHRVSAITPEDRLEADHRQDILTWIDSGAPLFRTERPATPPKHLIAYIVPIDPRRGKMLLGEHIKAALWLPPGGHVDPGEHPDTTARRELQEELFVDLPLLFPDPIFVTVNETNGAVSNHTDVSLWYVFEADSTQPLNFDDGEFTSVQWFDLNRLPLDNADRHLGRFTKKLQGLLEKRQANA